DAEAVQAPHIDIAQHEIGRLGSSHFHALIAAGSCFDSITLPAQRYRQRPAQDRVVLDDEDLFLYYAVSFHRQIWFSPLSYRQNQWLSKAALSVSGGPPSR